jgi:hypothetical protein
MENQTTTEKTDEKKVEEPNTPASTINWGAMALAALAGGAIGYLLSSQSSSKTTVNDDLEIDDSDRVERWELQKQKQEKKLKEEKRVTEEKQSEEINHPLHQEKLNKKVERKIAAPQKKSSTYIQIK